MRHKWPVLAAVIPVVFGWALIAAYPAAATAGGVGASGASASGLAQPGGLLGRGSAVSPRTWGGRKQHRKNVVASSNWAGYADTGPNGDFANVASSWVQPAGHCGAGVQYAAFWVGLDGYSSRT